MKKEEQKRLDTLSARLSYLLQSKRMSQAVLADALKASQANVSRWISGSIPETQFAVALSRRLSVPMEWLLYGVGPTPSESDAFLAELKEHRLPDIENLLASAEKKSSSVLAAHPEYLDQLRSIRMSLLGLVAHTEKTGEILAPTHLQNPVRFITKDRVHIIDEKGSLSRLGETGPLDRQTSHAMLCSLLDLPIGASIAQIKGAYELRIKARPSVKDKGKRKI